jgi:Ni,Fe-hydrogenase III large subunit/Ni,Fe-hydrogenase III component G
MNIAHLCERYGVPFRLLLGAAPLAVAEVDAAGWLRVAKQVRAEGGRFVALWGTDRRPIQAQDIVSAVFCTVDGLLWLRLPLKTGCTYPDLCSVFPAADRMQRALFELSGVCADEANDMRPWLNHGMWPRDYFPLRRDCPDQEQVMGELVPYPFIEVDGDGVHEIAVGPIHAGIIEPGHFRFSVVGEKVLRLEQRLGYTHKGTERLFIGHTLAEGAQLAGRVSGDSTVAFAWAFCMAAETACAWPVTERANWLRVLLLERERIANHLGDLGALGNDAGLAIGLSQFSRLKEDWVRLNAGLFGHRFMMDCIVPGGVTIDLPPQAQRDLITQCDKVEQKVTALRALYEGHSGLQDRFISTGKVSPKLAAELGLCGLAGRASAQSWDARTDQAMGPYAQLNVRMATHRNGDVAARVQVRFDEIFESIRLLREVVLQFPPTPTAIPSPPPALEGMGAGWVEGWRGAVFVGLETDRDGTILRCHCHDPSWQNWPVLQHAIMGNIVPDFPLINKSFNLSYSGHDL